MRANSSIALARLKRPTTEDDIALKRKMTRDLSDALSNSEKSVSGFGASFAPVLIRVIRSPQGRTGMPESPSLSKHLLESYESRHPHRVSGFASSSSSSPQPNLVTSGMTSYNANMHGAPPMSMPSQMYAFGTQPVKSEYVEPAISQETAMKIAKLQSKLDMKLGPEFISTRPGLGGGPKLSYVEGWKVINLANEVFGFNGWSSTIINLSVDFIDGTEETKKYSVGVSSIVRVTLRDGVFHEDVGYGLLENSKSKGAALDKVCYHDICIH